MQLVAYGAQDIYLTGNPQITFFKIVYRRHTNFATESIDQTFNGTVGFGNKVTAIISRNGDLIKEAFLEVTMQKGSSGPSGTSASGPTSFYPGEALLNTVQLEIGGQQIDQHYSDWLHMYNELFRKDEASVAYRRLVDFTDNEPTGAVKRFYVPLIFFFNRNPGLALPLIALQYHEVRINFTFEGTTVMGLAGIDTGTTPTATLWVDYVYLDTDERRRFAQVSHEMLIDQLQFTGSETVAPSSTATVSYNIRLNYNHPVKYIAWNFNGGSSKALGWYAGNVANVGTASEWLAPMYSAKLQLNGHDRFNTRYGSYFNRVQPFQTVGAAANAGVYMYSFALRPDEHQPSGTCNFSRIDNATLNLTLKQAPTSYTAAANVTSESTTVGDCQQLTNLNIYAVNYNVLRIMSGINSPVPKSRLPERFPNHLSWENSISSGRTAAACA
jgi:hypothetical protein